MNTQSFIYLPIIASLALLSFGCNRDKVRRDAPREVIVAEQPPAPPAPPSDEFYMRQDGGGGYTDGGIGGPNAPGGDQAPRFRLPPPKPGDDIGEGGYRGRGRDRDRDTDDRDDQPNTNPAWEYRTGGFFSEELFYVGAGPDELVPSLRVKMESVEAVYRERNQALADKILLAKLNVSKGLAEITLALTTGGRDRHDRPQYETVVVVGGYLGHGTSTVGLSADQNPLGVPMDGELRCMDESPKRDACETAFLRLAVGHPGERAISNMIFRTTHSKIHVQYPESEEESHSKFYRNIRNYLFNAQADKDVPERFHQIEYSSFAVIMGRSGFHVQMDTRDEKMIEFKGALLASKSGRTNIVTTLPRSFGDFYDYQFADGIQSTHLINTDGRGEISLRVVTKADSRGPEEEMIFKFLRKVRPTKPL